MAKCKAQLIKIGFSEFAASEGCKAIANGADEVEIDDRIMEDPWQGYYENGDI